MNPNFTRSVADRNAVRNEYIKNLQLETANNLTNYNANQIFKESGVLPPSITSMVDTRSITEKYADIQKARVALISGLREITDGANSNEIVSQIHGNDILDLLNNLPQIIAELKPKWSLGIPAPAFMVYWNRYRNALTANSGVATYPFIQSNQLLTNIIGILQNIEATLPTHQSLRRLRGALSALPQGPLQGEALDAIDNATTQTDAIRQAAEDNAQAGDNIDPIERQQSIQLLNDLLSAAPTQSSVAQLTSQAEVAFATGNSPQQAQVVYTNTISLIQPQDIDISQMEEGQSPFGVSPRTPSSARSLSQESEGATTIPASMTTQAEGGEPAFPTSYVELSAMPFETKKRYIRYIIETGGIKKSDIEWGSAGNLSGLRNKNIFETNLPDLLTNYFNKNQPPPVLKTGYGSKKKLILSEDEEETPSGNGIKPRRTIHGRGLSQPQPLKSTLQSGVTKQKYVPKLDKSKKVEKVPSYVEFGSHIIHQHNLVGGILKLRNKSGSSVPDIPTQAIGGKLKKVLMTLTGTGSPSFEEINDLSDSDKSLLNKVVKKAKIDQRLLVPTPDKTKEEQDFNKLQILSGEINAGNNNPHIVKELKILLMKMKNIGRLPRRQANEIMEDLLSLGY